MSSTLTRVLILCAVPPTPRALMGVSKRFSSKIELSIRRDPPRLCLQARHAGEAHLVLVRTAQQGAEQRVRVAKPQPLDAILIAAETVAPVGAQTPLRGALIRITKQLLFGSTLEWSSGSHTSKLSYLQEEKDARRDLMYGVHR